MDMTVEFAGIPVPLITDPTTMSEVLKRPVIVVLPDVVLPVKARLAVP